MAQKEGHPRLRSFSIFWLGLLVAVTVYLTSPLWAYSVEPHFHGLRGYLFPVNAVEGARYMQGWALGLLMGHAALLAQALRTENRAKSA